LHLPEKLHHFLGRGLRLLDTGKTRRSRPAQLANAIAGIPLAPRRITMDYVMDLNKRHGRDLKLSEPAIESQLWKTAKISLTSPGEPP
jgi:hypothetical protein